MLVTQEPPRAHKFHEHTPLTLTFLPIKKSCQSLTILSVYKITPEFRVSAEEESAFLFSLFWQDRQRVIHPLLEALFHFREVFSHSELNIVSNTVLESLVIGAPLLQDS